MPFDPRMIDPRMMGQMPSQYPNQKPPTQMPHNDNKMMDVTPPEQAEANTSEPAIPDPMTEWVPPIGDEQVKEAEEILKRYKEGKTALEQRIVENEKWFRMRHWDVTGHSKNRNAPEPKSAWLFNSIANKHADAMDNYPRCSVLPREEQDKQDARTLTSVLPTVLDQNEFEQTYSDIWWYKLKTGTGVTGVFWDSAKLNGLGDISIRALDILNLFWEPGVTDIQQSRHMFHVQLYDRDEICEQYPVIKEGMGEWNGSVDVAKYAHDDTIDTHDKVLVVDWYYKRKMPSGKTVLHYCKFCSGKVLYASENEDAYRERGYYDHGRYPFVFDVLFPVADSPAGFGYIDVMKSTQIYIDKLDQSLLMNTIAGSRPRWWVRGDGNVNEQEYADLEKDFVHFTGSGTPEDSIRPIAIPDFNSYAVTMRSLKVDELKETSGNRDFSQGGTSAGVTAASAVAALQEAGSKLSRDMIKGAYRSFAQIGYLCIDLMRQFYDEPRTFRITGEQGQTEFAQFGGMMIRENEYSDDFLTSTRMPYFDLKVSAQKDSPFSVVAENERAKELYQLGFFRPEMADQSLLALDMMQFEGIDNIRQKISEGQTMFNNLQQMSQLSMAMAQQLDAVQGTQYTQQVAQIIQGGMQQGMPVQSVNPEEPETDSIGNSFANSMNSRAGEARKKVASNATPK